MVLVLLENLGDLLNDFQKGINQTVAVNGALFKDISIHSRVRQGTVLGSPMSGVALSDMASVIQSVNLTSFTDERKMSQVVKNPDEILNLQNNMHAIYKWTYENNM